MKRFIYILIFLFTSIQFAEAKNEIYRTISSGSWETTSIWEVSKDGGKTWHSASGYPEYHPIRRFTVIISKGTKVTHNKDVTVTRKGHLYVEGDLSIKSTFRVYDAGHVKVSGNLYIESLDAVGAMQGSWTGKIEVTSKGYIGVTGKISLGSGTNIDNDGAIATTEGNDGMWESDGDIYYNESSVNPRPAFLPIKLKSFTVSLNNSIANFNWITASEQNNDYFTLEQSTDLQSWESIHTEQGAGNSSAELYYSAEKELNKVGVYYFRLKQTDYDGKFTYSQVVSLKNTKLPKMQQPKAVVGNGSIIIKNTYHNLQIFNMQGRLVGQYSNTKVISDFNEQGVFIFVFDNQYKQKININF